MFNSADTDGNHLISRKEKDAYLSAGGIILRRFLTPPTPVIEAVFMLQKEVVDRLAAAPGSADYGRLSVITQWRCDVRPLFNIAREAFTPPPKVVSTVVRLEPRREPQAHVRMESLEKVTAAAFGQRRKMLRYLGAEVDLTPREKGMKGSIARALELVAATPGACRKSAV